MTSFHSLSKSAHCNSMPPRSKGERRSSAAKMRPSPCEKKDNVFMPNKTSTRRPISLPQDRSVAQTCCAKSGRIGPHANGRSLHQLRTRLFILGHDFFERFALGKHLCVAFLKFLKPLLCMGDPSQSSKKDNQLKKGSEAEYPGNNPTRGAPESSAVGSNAACARPYCTCGEEEKQESQHDALHWKTPKAIALVCRAPQFIQLPLNLLVTLAQLVGVFQFFARECHLIGSRTWLTERPQVLRDPFLLPIEC